MPAHRAGVRRGREGRSTGLRASEAHSAATSFEEEGVAPGVLHFADLFAEADNAEAMLPVKVDASKVFWEDPCLEGPETFSFALVYEPF